MPDVANGSNAFGELVHPTPGSDLPSGESVEPSNLHVRANEETYPLHSQGNSQPITGAGSKLFTTADNPDVFTFHPKISKKSRRISETLETDFMSRQQKHLEKQQKYYHRAINYEANERVMDMAAISKEKENGRLVTSAAEGLPQLQAIRHETLSAELSKEHQHRHMRTLDGVELQGEDQPDVRTARMKSMISDSDITLATEHDAPQLSSGDNRTAAKSLSMSYNQEDSTMNGSSPKTKRRTSHAITADRLRQAKLTAEKAIKEGKIFTVIGPYHRVREVMRNRGWVEKFYRLNDGPQPPPRHRSPRQNQQSDDDDDYDDPQDDDDAYACGGSKVPPWEEDDGIYGIMSRLVRNVPPTFIWSLRKDQVDFRFLKKEQIVNHHARACSFTTKVGLCRNLRQLPWFENESQDKFFPRCYVLSVHEEKEAFIQDFRSTSCASFVRHLVENFNVSTGRSEVDDNEEDDDGKESPKDWTESDKENSQGRETSGAQKTADSDAINANSTKKEKVKKGKRLQPKIQYQREHREDMRVPARSVDIALHQCKKITEPQDHIDIDCNTDPFYMSDSEWNEFLQWYYAVVHHDATVLGAENRMGELQETYEQLQETHPQFSIDGCRNVWIVKPGAKSRGRGIVCQDRLDTIANMVRETDISNREARLVVQKYIERPLLVHNTKFDIRQWFLVSDWNPLTIWWYKEFYLRFCSQEFTLEDFNEAVHLSNNSIQYKYENGPRHQSLPDHNMWEMKEFQRYLKDRGYNHFDTVLYPGMKKHVINAMLCCQDCIEVRKNCFELYGADFMVSDDYKPWLIEINSSPCMSPSTPVTARLTASVLEDSVRVVLDRRFEKSSEIGGFELVYKQPVVNIPPYIGIDLTVEGTHIRRPWNHSTSFSADTVPQTVRHPAPPSNPPPVSKPTTLTFVSRSSAAAAPCAPRVPPVVRSERKPVVSHSSEDNSNDTATRESQPTHVPTAPRQSRTFPERRPAPMSVIRPVRARGVIGMSHRGATRVELVNLGRNVGHKMPSINSTGNQRGAPRASVPNNKTSSFKTQIWTPLRLLHPSRLSVQRPLISRTVCNQDSSLNQQSKLRLFFL